jgi:2-(1,2-epoxy-1,2-dihydrophenyl)acetyl-CoA isomerase
VQEIALMSPVIDQPILVTKADGYRVLTFNRPEKLNAFTAEMNLLIQAALADADADEACRALLITAAGRGFTAGQDLGGLTARGNRSTRATLEDLYNPIARTIADYRMPIVCAINGIAAGAGLNLALGCDIVIAARSAKFLQPFSKIGLIPDGGGTWHLPRLVGAARARALMMLAEPVTAEQAVAMGMIWRVVDDAVLLTEAHALAARLAVMPTRALADIRRALIAAETSTLALQLDLERDMQERLSHEPDSAEGIASFLEKRQPTFTGRKA